MKKLVLLLVLVSAVAVAQQAPAPPVQATNLKERVEAPSYSDMYCAGFLSRQAFDHSKYVAANQESPQTSLAVTGNIVYLNGTGYQENQLYSLVRELRDPNKYELFPGQRKLLMETGLPFAELGRVRVFQVRANVAIAKIEFSCQPITAGDLVVPFQEKAQVLYRKDKTAFNEFPINTKQVGRIIMAREFDMFLGTGKKVYINAGGEQGLKPGDYVRVMRGYLPSEMDAPDRLSYKTPPGEDTQRNTSKMYKSEPQGLPRRALGEIIILNVTPTSATGMITVALDAIHVGDAVDVEAPQQ